MSRRFSSILAGMLLASFLVGGTAAPTLHRVHHAQEHQQARAAATAQCAHGAIDRPLMEEGSADISLEHCWILARHVLDVPPPSAWQTAALQQEAMRSAVVLALHTSGIEGRFVIRGPPGRA